MGPIFTNLSVGSAADRWTHCSSSAFPWNCLFHGVTLCLCLYLESCSPTGEDDTSDFCRCFVAGHILPDIFLNFVFPVEFGEWISSRIVLSASLPTLFPGESTSCSFLGYGFSPGLFCPHSYPTLFPGGSASCSFWGMDFLDLSRISVAPSLSCKYSLFYFQVSGGAFAGLGIQFGVEDLSRTFAEL